MPTSLPKLLVDVNVFLDVMLPREQWLAESADILETISQKRAAGFVSPHAVTTVYYIVERKEGREKALTAVADVLQICDVVPLTSDDFHRALALGLRDFEDAVTAVAALSIGADYIVTRSEKDFSRVPVSVRSPGGLLALLPKS